MKSLIIYDLDGTLVDTRKDIVGSVNFMLGQMGRPAMTGRVIEGYVGQGIQVLVSRCLGTDDPKEIEKGIRMYRRHYGEHMLDHSRLYPGAKAVLEHFKTRRQAVLTNKPDPYSSQILEGLGVDGYFMDIIAGDSRFPKKPDPAAVLDLMAREGVGPEETLLMGDSPVDVETGARAGVEALLLSHGFTPEEELRSDPARKIFSDFFSLLVFIKAQGW